MTDEPIRRAQGECRWEGVDVLDYKREGAAPFKKVTRQLLFRTDDLGCELRYFEVAANGHSTLERHRHSHAVMILRRRGACLVGSMLRAVGPHDLVHIPPLTWHQFRASGAAPLAALRADPTVAAFIRVSRSSADRETNTAPAGAVFVCHRGAIRRFRTPRAYGRVRPWPARLHAAVRKCG